MHRRDYWTTGPAPLGGARKYQAVGISRGVDFWHLSGALLAWPASPAWALIRTILIAFRLAIADAIHFAAGTLVNKDGKQPLPDVRLHVGMIRTAI